MNLCRPPAETNVRSLRESLPLLAFCEWGRIIDAVIFDHGLNNWPISLVDPSFDTCICVAERVKGDFLWSAEDEEEVPSKYCFKGCKWSVKCVHILFHFINSRRWFEIIINFQKYIYMHQDLFQYRNTYSILQIFIHHLLFTVSSKMIVW